jgi:phage-related baseplate assembly protein
VDVDTEPDWHKNIDVLGGHMLDQVSAAVLEDSQRICPVSRDGSNGNPPGTLLDSLRRAVGETSARVGSDLDYSVWVNEGHRVAYRNSAGVIVYTGDVVAGQDFLRPPLFTKRVVE